MNMQIIRRLSNSLLFADLLYGLEDVRKAQVKIRFEMLVCA